jgi:hypothetical protein
VLREVFDLSHRQLMNDSEVALVLGISERRARRLRSRADTALAEAGAAFVPYRAAQRAGAPSGLRERILASAATPGHIAQRAEIAKPRRRSGFPVPLDRAAVRRYQHTGRSVALVAASLAVLALVLFAVSSAPISVIRLSGGSSPSPSPSGKPAGGAQGSPSPAAPSAPATPSPAAPSPSPTPAAPPPARPRPAPPAAAPGQITGPLGKCLNVLNGKTADGTLVDIVPCNRSAAQHWTRGRTGTLETLGKCLDFQQPRAGRAQDAVLWQCDGTASQRWVAAGALLISRANNMCLEVPPGRFENFSTARIGTCTGAENQRWKIIS